MNISIKRRIYLSFSLLVCLFVLNGIFTNITLNKNNKLFSRLSKVIDPSLQTTDDFKKIMLESKTYITNWVFLRYKQEDKDLLEKLHDSDYQVLKSRLNIYSSHWVNKNWVDSLNKVYAGFEKLLAIEKSIMISLKEFSDYDNPVIKLDAERKVEEEVFPRTAALINSLNVIYSNGMRIRAELNEKLEHSSMQLRMLVIILAITIICAGIILSIYMTKVIIKPINSISYIVNDLGKGITRKIDHNGNNNEIGKMIQSVNSLSEKLQATTTFAHEVGIRNFDMPFKPLSDEDTLGKALIAMRDNIKSSDEKLNEAQQIAHIGSWERDIATDKMTLSDEMFSILDIDPLSFDFLFPSILKFVHPDDMENTLDSIRKNHFMVPVPFECRIVTSKGIIKNIFIETKLKLGNHGEIKKTFGIVQDITERKKSEMNLVLKNKELEQKNKELEQFAYVASHDLQEPLRTTSSFVELFQQQYQGKLDEKADKYLDYIVQASERMKAFIIDLLEYSRIGSKKELKQIDCNIVLNEVLADLDTAIHEADAEIETGPLPVISGYQTEIKQLFQNLAFNAIKFRQKNIAPRIKITARRERDNWQFAFTDNGIGIAKEHNERIFVIFQRLHTRNEYKVQVSVYPIAKK